MPSAGKMRTQGVAPVAPSGYLIRSQQTPSDAGSHGRRADIVCWGPDRDRQDVGNGLNGCPYTCFVGGDGSHASGGRTPAKHRPLLPPSPFGAEHEAVVFDNFEESGPTTPASEADADAKGPL
ncbi:hypothetical protein L1887_43403 [Cichorium endivia]|nr:hypothetical protein L1887_43403 [Cichorium endivia]